MAAWQDVSAAGSSTDVLRETMPSKAKGSMLEGKELREIPRTKKVSPIPGFRRGDHYRKVRPIVELSDLLELAPKGV
jgi:hypothetical protein